MPKYMPVSKDMPIFIHNQNIRIFAYILRDRLRRCCVLSLRAYFGLAYKIWNVLQTLMEGEWISYFSD